MPPGARPGTDPCLGFWAGITLGRFILTHLAHRVGEVRFVYALGVGATIFQILAWFIPNVMGDAGRSFSKPVPDNAISLTS